jgi:hypothetical protein
MMRDGKAVFVFGNVMASSVQASPKTFVDPVQTESLEAAKGKKYPNGDNNGSVIQSASGVSACRISP